MTDTEVSTDVDTDTMEDTLDMKDLFSKLATIGKDAELLRHRIDTVATLIDQNTFEFDKVRLHIAPTSKANHVRELLITLELEEENLRMDAFLKALNNYLIKKELVDLNDLQIVLNPLLAAAFQKPPGLKKVPYALLLRTLPRMFL